MYSRSRHIIKIEIGVFANIMSLYADWGKLHVISQDSLQRGISKHVITLPDDHKDGKQSH